MTALKYIMGKNHWSIKALADASGMSMGGIRSLMDDTEHKCYIHHYIAVARQLHVTLDELMATYPDDALVPGDHYEWPYRSDKCVNCVEQYRRSHNLNLSELAPMIGITTREGARLNCIAP